MKREYDDQMLMDYFDVSMMDVLAVLVAKI